ncbi:MAG: hypothetical protein JWL77_3649 [Chthonomonadaceae bacterium]|nr:hypothetical protein [Chthonomonadaceae bacterium]
MRLLNRFVPLCGLVLAISSGGFAQRQSSPPILPDRTRTPGDVLDVTKDDICVPGYSKKVRNVPKAVKDQVYASYGITHHATGEYEVDHLISLELGGSNSIKNLWPQSYKTTPWNAHVKDKLENRLHSDVCSGKIDLKTAQQQIAVDWIAAYKSLFGNTATTAAKTKRNSSGSQTSATETGTASADKVWVNTKSGKYFLPGARYYGKTKEGQYMTEAEAKKQGFTAAKGQ